MSTTKVSIGYLLSTMSLAIMLTACGDGGSGGTHMQIQESGRQVVSDNNQASFQLCAGGTQNNSQNNYNNQYNQQYNQQYSNYGGEIRIEYSQSYSNNNQQNYNQNYNNQYNQNYNQNYNAYPVQASIVIVRGQSGYYGNNQQSSSGYQLASLNVSGLQSGVSTQSCQVQNVNDSGNSISGSITCGGYNGSGNVQISFACQKQRI